MDDRRHSKPKFKVIAIDGVSRGDWNGYLGVVLFGGEEVYRTSEYRMREDDAIDDAEDWLRGRIAALLREGPAHA